MEIVVKNYRPFTSDHPLKLQVSDGITALVGSNNSGKSFVLKFFFEARNLFEFLANSFSHVSRIRFQFDFRGIENRDDAFSKFNKDDIEVNFSSPEYSLLLKLYRKEEAGMIEKISFNGKTIDENHNLKELNLRTNDDEIIDIATGKPILNIRDILGFFKKISDSIYFPSFRNVVNIGSKENFYDISIGEAFVKEWQDFTTNPASSVKREKALQVEEDLREIFRYTSFNIRSATRRNEMVVNINGKSYLLSELGSGMTQFILVFINAAIREPSFILIDEPESNLHPKLQIDFINNLLKYAGSGIIFATHNLGLAHSVADRIYSVSKADDKAASIIKPFEKTPSFTEFLGELNFSNFPILGFKKVLLVEGPTDLSVFSVLLHKKKKYQDFLLWPLGGSSLINANTAKELAELKRLGEDIKVYCWLDSEKRSETGEIPRNRIVFKKEAEKLGFSVEISKRRSIENYFPIEAIKKINPKITKLGPYDETPSEFWNKGSNWRIAQEIEIEDLKGTDLYQFLEKI